MKSIRGGTHTTLTETASLVVGVLEKIPGVTMVSPGIINKTKSRSGNRRVVGIFTNAGLELLITGQSTQKVAAHCNAELAPHIFNALTESKKLSEFTFKTRAKKPGI